MPAEEALVAASPLSAANGVKADGAHADTRPYFPEGPCAHAMKKKLVDNRKVRDSLKKGHPKCVECVRKEQETSSPLSFCLTCGVRLCGAHVRAHSTAPRTGDEHPFYLDEATLTVRCFACEVTVNLEDAVAVRMLLLELKSMMRMKATKPTDKTSDEKPSVLDKPPFKAEKKPQMNGSNGASSEDSSKKSNGLLRKASSSEQPASSPPKPAENGYANGTGAGERPKNGIILPKNTAIPAKGLANLGNTCFFNSVMQCMLHTHQLAFYLERFGRVTRLNFVRPTKPIVVNDEKVEIEEATLAIPFKSTPLNDALKAFIVDFRNGRSPSPSNLFDQISYKAVRFRSMAQQDAHELLRYLLDGLCSEETNRYQEAIAARVGAPLKSAIKVDPEIMRKAKAYLQQAGRPLLDAVFGGRLLQTIRCSKCHHVSERYENLYDLSVPLTGAAAASGRRSSGGVNPSSSSSNARVSKHQLKKEQKTAKKAKKGSRTLKSQESKTGEDEGSIEAKVEGLQLNGEENGGEASDADEERSDAGADEGESSGCDSDYSYRPIEKAVDPLDLTKVLTTMKPGALPAGGGQSVAASLKEFTDEEKLEGANAYECEKCCTPVNKKKGATGAAKTRVEATKRYLIVTPPVVLTIHVKRFQQTHVGMKMTTRKVSGHVHFPLIFDIAPFCCKNVERIAPGQTSILYALYGVVSHSGNLYGGHYVAYVKSRERIPQTEAMLEAARAVCADMQAEPSSLSSPSSSSPPPSAHATPEDAEKDVPAGQWYYCSDYRVSAISESKVLNEEAYLLFYERIY